MCIRDSFSAARKCWLTAHFRQNLDSVHRRCMWVWLKRMRNGRWPARSRRRPQRACSRRRKNPKDRWKWWYTVRKYSYIYGYLVASFFRILTEPVPYAFVSVSRRNNEARANTAVWSCDLYVVGQLVWNWKSVKFYSRRLSEGKILPVRSVKSTTMSINLLGKPQRSVLAFHHGGKAAGIDMKQRNYVYTTVR